jgi:apolipoprotein N-acyltransferase
LRLSPRVEALAAALLGALQTLAFVHTGLWPLPLLTTAFLAWRAAQAGPQRAAWLGWLYGTAWLTAGTWWLYISMHRYGGLPAPLAAAAVLALSAALSLYLALALALFARWRSGRLLPDTLLFAALWLLAELARGVLLTGFPWVASGYAQVDAPLAALAPWIGVYGIGAVVAALAALLAGGWRPALVVPLVLAGLALGGTMSFSQPTSTLSLVLLQTNVAQDEKFALERMPATLAWVAQALTASDADLALAPETAVPLLPDQLEELAPGYWDALTAHFTRSGRSALVGVPLGNIDLGYTNSVVGLGGADYRYDKTHLVPFGEFIPTGFHWFTAMMNIPLGDFNRGTPLPPSFTVRGERVAPNICYEDLFGEELARRFAGPDRVPTMFANISNIGWFGDTIAVPQHLNISRLRSLEFQRPMLRATNTGATAVIDHRGQVTAMLPPHTQGVLRARVQGRSGLTPFARWSAAAGLWPPALLALLWVAVVGTKARRRRS